MFNVYNVFWFPPSQPYLSLSLPHFSFHGKTEGSHAPCRVFFLISRERHTITRVYSPFWKELFIVMSQLHVGKFKQKVFGKAVECLSCSNKASIAQQERGRKMWDEDICSAGGHFWKHCFCDNFYSLKHNRK